MNDRTRSVLEKMRKNTQAVVDAARDKIATTRVTQPEVLRRENYQVIAFPIRAPMNASINRHPGRHRKLQELLV